MMISWAAAKLLSAWVFQVFAKLAADLAKAGQTLPRDLTAPAPFRDGMREGEMIAVAAPFRFRRLPPSHFLSAGARSRAAFASLLLVLLALSGVRAFAQNTTISGTVYDPRGASGLPLPNVLVYASTTPVAAPASGVQCLTVQTPSGANVVASTYTAVDGTFTLANVPENANYTIVIQAGKWQRQFSETVAADPLTGLALSMPANHTEGNIPMIAIATGSVDGAECVLRDMGISDSEFTDDTGSVNPGGYIHLYKGSYSAGADISSSTPSETLLMTNASTTPLDDYDMVMFPCQGTASNQATATGATNLLNFANAGGRIFATHFSYAWLDPDSPYNAQFGTVANWTISPEHSVPSAIGTVLTNFSDGATLAQWLQNSGATIAGTSDQIDISTLRTDVGSVIAPTQSWLTLNSGSYSGQSGNPVMQMTFNTPVGSPAASQCGRVMYNDYHVINETSASGKVYPTECPSYNNPSYQMSAQEEMLEYALFDLSAFVQPVVVPTLTIAFNPSPLAVDQNQTGDQLVVSVTNTSSTTQIDSSAILTFTLPQLVTVTAMTDSGGGWVCTVATATCTRNSSLGAGVTDSVTLTLSVGAYPAGGLSSYTGSLTATVSSVTFYSNVSASDTVIYAQPPTITWPTPAPIVYGTALSATQLDATASVAGTFTYSPAAGAVLPVGQQTLTANFVPNDTTDYSSATASVTLTVLAITPNITLASSANDVFLTTPVTFTATIPSPGNTPPTGTVTFYDGATAIGSSPLSGGSASITTSTLPAGAQSITAVYSGDSNYGPGTSAALSENIQDFTLTAAGGGTATALPASQASFTLILTPVGGPTLPGAISLSATNLPAGTSAAFNPASVSANSPTTNVVLQVKLSGSAALHRPGAPFGKGSLPVSLALILLPFSVRRSRARLRMLVLLAIMGIALAAGVSGCGGSHLSPQSFSFPVTAQSGGLSHSITVQLTVEANL